MKGPFRRIRSPRPPSDPASEVEHLTPDAPVSDDAQVEVLPAGLAPEDVVPAPSFRNRGRLRRRLRYLRRVRELGFRDLGGLAFDLHRFGRRNDELVVGKLQALDAVDRELRALERVLDDRRDLVELREPGIAACPRCGALHGSEARFCPSCGTQFSGPQAIGEVGGPPAVPPVTAPLTPSSPVTASDPLSGVLSQTPPSATEQATAVEQATTAEQAAVVEQPAATEQPTVVVPPAHDSTPGS